MEFLADLHPKIIHFPIVLLLCYLLIEFTAVLTRKSLLANIAYIFLFIGAVFTFISAFTGNEALTVFNELDINSHKINDSINKHQFWANVTSWFYFSILILRTLFLVQVVIRKKYLNHYLKFHISFIILGLIGCLFIYKTAELGGTLVYKYGIGTELIKITDKKEIKLK